jgi:hypothetical protein
MKKRTSMKWTSLTLIVSLLLTALPPITGFAAGERITVTNLYKATTIVNGKPAPSEDASIHRFTNNPITIEASIDGINTTQVPNIYYEITNVNTGQTVTDTTNKAQLVGSFNIVFSNVFLTEGLNKVVLKMGGNVTIVSEARWAYFIPTTSLQDLRVNSEIWNETKIYPDVPTSSTSINITGKAPNATDVQVQLFGDASPKSLFLSNSEFLATGDDINKLTNTDFKFTPGDNYLTLTALNSSKSYTLEKNLVYDNGDPFAFNANIQGIVNDEVVVVPATLTDKVYLKHSPVILSSVVVYTSPNKTGTLLATPADYSVAKETTGVNTGRTYIVFTADSGTTRYISYKLDSAKLKTNPVITPSRVKLDALIKNDVNASNQGEYKYLEVEVGGRFFGPYDLSQYDPSPLVTNHYPATIHVGHSDMHVIVTGQSLSDTGLTIDVEDSAGVTVGTLARVTSADAYAVFTLPAALVQTTGTYTFKVKKADGTVVGLYTQTVNDPDLAVTAAVVTSAAITAINEGYSAGQAANTLTIDKAALAASDILIEVYNLAGNPVGAATGVTNAGGGDYTYTLPLGLLQGNYRVVYTVENHIITEKHLSIGAVPLTAPTVTAVVTPEKVGTFNSGGGAVEVTSTYIAVEGTNFGTDITKVSLSLLDSDGTGANVTLTPYSIENNRIIFRLADTSQLLDEAGISTYDLDFRINRGTDYDFSIDNAIEALLYEDGTTYDLNAYAGQIVTAVDRTEITLAEAQAPATAPVTVTGLKLNADRLQIRILNEDGTSAGLADATYTVNGGATQATVTLPAGLLTGHYFIEFVDNDDDGTGTSIRLAKYPLTVVNPAWSSLTPNTVPISDLAATDLIVQGSNLGRSFSSYSLRFTDTDNINRLNLPATAIESGSKLIFDPAPNTLSTLTKGTYTTSLLYNGTVLASTQQFTVASEPATLIENLARSKSGQYQVFDFSVEVDIGNDLQQFVKFKFYNNPTAPKYSTFRFTYIDPNLPYVERLDRMPQNTPLSEVAVNEINELPATFKLIADSKTNKINIYLGEYNNSSIPYKTMVGLNAVTGYQINAATGKHEYTFTLDNIPNGQQLLTIVPSSSTSVAGDKKAGENASGRKAYTMLFTNTPYIIVNNMYTGLVIRNESEISCTAIIGPCIAGRLVNVPLENYGSTTAESKVEFYLNDNLSNAVNLDAPSLPNFHVQLPNLEEGKNKLAFVIYLKQNGIFVKVTESIFEIFKFSTDAPQFISLNPIEPNVADIKFKKTSGIQDAYATTQSTVQFIGQFANATELKLVVRRTKDDGTAETISDRRYGVNFTQIDPVSGNPNYLISINATTGQFTTNSIVLSKKGDTTFEFTITNASNILITKTIVITREPLPYVIVSPKVTKNAKGIDQANINSNYIELQIDAESADQVLFGKNEAIQRDVVVNGAVVKHFFYETTGLKTGSNSLKFTVVTGDEEYKGELVLFNTNTKVEGAQFKTPLKSTIKAFDGMVELKFPKGTNLMRNDSTAINQYISADRQILFGIAYQQDGRIDKYKHPAIYDGQAGNPNPTIIADAKFLLTEPTGRFKPAGKLIWVDAGTISNNTLDLKDAYNGSGKLPYDSVEFYNRQLKDLVVPTNRGELKLSYDSNIRNDAWKYLTVYHYDIYEDGTGVVRARWRNIGGVINTSAKTITVPFERFGYYQVMFMDQSYDDITSHPWARNNLDTLYAKGYMSAKLPPSQFVPNDPISRGEFATMLVRIFDIQLNYTETPTFTDVLRVNPLATALYDYKYIETAARAGIIRGMSGGRFQPDSSIRRQDAAVMIAKAANLKLGTDDAKNLKSLQKTFTDANLIDIYARAAVEAVVRAKQMAGKENTLLQGQTKATFRFDPTEPITRAEAATIAISVLQQQKKIPK